MSAQVKQEDLKRLMKERREQAKQKGKIDSPFAKYSTAGQLTCTVCNVVIKSNNLWSLHVSGGNHKEHLMKLKNGSSQVTSQTTSVVGSKRSLEQPTAVKKAKTDMSSRIPEGQDSSKETKAAILPSYSSSEDEMDVDSDVNSKSATPLHSNSTNAFPSDFFDAPPISKSDDPQGDKTTVASTTTALPEGFFDDPVLDAKARNIEYKDPVEEEWEKFQKSIAEETNVSKTIIQEDLEVSTLERDIDQIDEQILQWERAKNLQCLADDVKVKAPKKGEGHSDSESADDSLEEDDLLDWRSKSINKL